MFFFFSLGSPDQLQPNVGRVPVHDRQALRRQIRHRGQSNPMRSSQRRIQTVASVACKGNKANFFINPCLLKKLFNTGYRRF